MSLGSWLIHQTFGGEIDAFNAGLKKEIAVSHILASAFAALDAPCIEACVACAAQQAADFMTAGGEIVADPFSLITAGGSSFGAKSRAMADAIIAQYGPKYLTAPTQAIVSAPIPTAPVSSSTSDVPAAAVGGPTYPSASTTAPSAPSTPSPAPATPDTSTASDGGPSNFGTNTDPLAPGD